MNQVLIISPHFPPINAPDHQRIRMSLPYFAEFEWKPKVLSVDPAYIDGTNDPLLLDTIPGNIQVTLTRAIPTKYTKWVGLNSLYRRSLFHLFKAGNQILRQDEIKLIYFSTTVFTALILGPLWHSRFGIPFVVDMQDPWLSDYHGKFPNSRPPGGRYKYGFSQTVAKIFEPYVMQQVSHVICVSPAYPSMLMARYKWLQPEQFTVLPFGGPVHDFELLGQLRVKQNIFTRNDGNQHWVYVGRGGDDMALPLRALFLAIANDRQHNAERWQRIRLHFVGTSYATGEQAEKTVEPLAREVGIADLVKEYPERVPYFEALQLLKDSDAILVIGSNDKRYTASKLYPCILAHKALFAIFHEESSVVDILHQCEVGTVVTFTGDSMIEGLSQEIVPHLQRLIALPSNYQPSTNWVAFQPFTAYEMTRKQCNIFDACIQNHE